MLGLQLHVAVRSGKEARKKYCRMSNMIIVNILFRGAWQPLYLCALQYKTFYISAVGLG